MANPNTDSFKAFLDYDGVTRLTEDLYKKFHGVNSVFVGATSLSGGTYGQVPEPKKGQQNHILFGDAKWHEIADLVQLLPLATYDSVGVVSIGDDIYVSDEGRIYLAKGSSSIRGVVKIGSHISYDSDGTIFLTQQDIIDAIGYQPALENTTYSLATRTSNGLMSSDDYGKLADIEEGANKYILPIATSSSLGGVKIGENISISSEGVLSVPTVSSSHNGVMSAADKSKLDAIEEGANNFVLPKASANSLGGVKIGSNLTISADGVLSADKSDYGIVTDDDDGMMPATLYSHLKGVEEGANKYILPVAAENTLGGVMIGDIITISAEGKIGIPIATTTEDGAMSYLDRIKLNGIASNANNYVLPVAAADSLGGVKVSRNSGLTISNQGQLSVTYAPSLQSARSIAVSLDSSISNSFDGSNDVILGVNGILETQHGGTGASDLTLVTVGTASSLATNAVFRIMDKREGHSGTESTFQGYNNVILYLPETIDSEINGNASTATRLKNNVKFIVNPVKDIDLQGATFYGSETEIIQIPLADNIPESCGGTGNSNLAQVGVGYATTWADYATLSICGGVEGVVSIRGGEKTPVIWDVNVGKKGVYVSRITDSAADIPILFRDPSQLHPTLSNGPDLYIDSTTQLTNQVFKIGDDGSFSYNPASKTLKVQNLNADNILGSINIAKKLSHAINVCTDLGNSSTDTTIQGDEYQINIPIKNCLDEYHGGTGKTNLMDVTVGTAVRDCIGHSIDTYYAPLESPLFTGKPSISNTPDYNDDTNGMEIANVQFVRNSITTLIGYDFEEWNSKLDTLKELAQAIADNETYSDYVDAELAKKLDASMPAESAHSLSPGYYLVIDLGDKTHSNVEDNKKLITGEPIVDVDHDSPVPTTIYSANTVTIGTAGILVEEHGGTGASDLKSVEVGKAASLSSAVNLTTQLDRQKSKYGWDTLQTGGVNVQIGVDGILGEENGGTGKNDLAEVTVGHASKDETNDYLKDKYLIKNRPNFGDTMRGPFEIYSTVQTAMANSNRPPLIIGKDYSTIHVAYDDDGIQARKSFTQVNSLWINRYGGDVNIGSSKGKTTGGTFNVTWPTNLSSTLTVTDTTVLHNTLWVNSNTTIQNGTLYVGKNSTLNGTVWINSNTTIANGSLDVKYDTNLRSKLFVAGNSSLHSDLIVDGNTTLKGTALIKSDTKIEKTFVALGASTLNNSLKVGCDTTIGKTLYVGSKTTLNSSLYVQGISSLHGAATLDSTLYVASKSTLTGAVKMLNTVDISSNTSIGGTLKVKGGTDLQSTLQVASNTHIGGAFVAVGKSTLVGESSLGNDVYVKGALTAQNTLYVNSMTTLHGALTVDNVSTFNNNVTVASGKTTSLGGPLYVVGLSSLTGAVRTGNTFYVTGASTLNGATTFNSNITVASGKTASLGGPLYVNGTSTLNGAVKTTTNVSIGGGLWVSSTTSLTGAVRTGNTFYVTGASTLNGATTFNNNVTVASGKTTSLGGPLYVVGTSTLNGAVKTTTNVSVGGGLWVSSTTSLTGAVRMGDNLYVNNNTTVHGSLYVDGFTSLSGDLYMKTGTKIKVGNTEWVTVNGSNSPPATIDAALKQTTYFITDLSSTSATSYNGTQSTVSAGVKNILPVSSGGTGASNAASARTNLGAAAAVHTHSVSDISGVLPVSKGGTGVTSLNSITVGGAVRDGIGREIKETYATKTELTSGIGSIDTSPPDLSAYATQEWVRNQINGIDTSGPDLTGYMTTNNLSLRLASSPTSTSNVTADQANPYLNLVYNSSVLASVRLSGDGATNVKGTSSGIVISSTAVTNDGGGSSSNVDFSDLSLSSVSGGYNQISLSRGNSYTASTVNIPVSQIRINNSNSATQAAFTETENSNTYLCLANNYNGAWSTSNKIQIKGAGATTVKYKDNVLTISSTASSVTSGGGTQYYAGDYLNLESGTFSLDTTTLVTQLNNLFMSKDGTVSSHNHVLADITDASLVSSVVLTSSATGNTPVTQTPTSNGNTYLNFLTKTSTSSGTTSIRLVGVDGTSVIAQNNTISISGGGGGSSGISSVSIIASTLSSAVTWPSKNETRKDFTYLILSDGANQLGQMKIQGGGIRFRACNDDDDGQYLSMSLYALGTAPSKPISNQVWFDINSFTIKVWVNNEWKPMGLVYS